MNYIIREMEPSEYYLLNDFLYEAIFIPKGIPAPPRSIILNEDLQVYVKGFGDKKDDKCFVAVSDKKIVGAVWVRIMNDYGNVDKNTPSFANWIRQSEKYRYISIKIKGIWEKEYNT